MKTFELFSFLLAPVNFLLINMIRIYLFLFVFRCVKITDESIANLAFYGFQNLSQLKHLTLCFNRFLIRFILSYFIVVGY